MADIILNNTQYNGVDAIEVPQVSGGTASFTQGSSGGDIVWVKFYEEYNEETEEWEIKCDTSIVDIINFTQQGKLVKGKTDEDAGDTELWPNSFYDLNDTNYENYISFCLVNANNVHDIWGSDEGDGNDLWTGAINGELVFYDYALDEEHEGKIPVVRERNIEWEPLPPSLPEFDEEDEDKLPIIKNGEIEWRKPAFVIEPGVTTAQEVHEALENLQTIYVKHNNKIQTCMVYDGSTIEEGIEPWYSITLTVFCSARYSGYQGKLEYFSYITDRNDGIIKSDEAYEIISEIP